jgi:hypothetical protein
MHKMEQTPNIIKFQETLAKHYRELFDTDKEYAYSKLRNTPEQLADKMTLSLITKQGSIEGKGIRRTCKELGIKHTYAGVNAYLLEPLK